MTNPYSDYLNKNIDLLVINLQINDEFGLVPYPAMIVSVILVTWESFMLVSLK